MVKVKTLKPHYNNYGVSYENKKGDVYDHPNPTAEIKAKLVKEVKTNVVQGKGRGVSGNGAKSFSAKNNNSKGNGETGDENLTDADKGTGAT